MAEENRYLSLFEFPDNLSLSNLQSPQVQFHGKLGETPFEKLEREEKEMLKKEEEKAKELAEKKRKEIERKRKELEEKQRLLDEEKKRQREEEERQKREEEEKKAAEEEKKAAEEKAEQDRLDEIAQEKQEKEDRIEDRKEKMGNLEWWEWIEVFAYVINLWVIAIPWTVFGFLMVLIQIFLNIDYNKGWAEGNVFLMANTIYAIIQFTLSIPLVYEIQTWLKHAKFIRLISLTWAFIYNTVWIAFAVKLWTMFKSYTDYDNSYDPVAKEEPDYIEIFTVMAIVYNLILHVVILPINTTIILKEFSMEFYQFLGVGDIVGSDKDDVSLGFHEVWELGLAFLELFNPWWWFSDDPWIYE